MHNVPLITSHRPPTVLSPIGMVVVASVTLAALLFIAYCVRGIRRR